MANILYLVTKGYIMGAITDELDEIVKKQEKVIAKIVADLFAELQSITPVGNPDIWETKYPPKNYIGGSLKVAWELSKTNDGWLISNSMEYADIILSERGFNPEFGKVAGSLQFPDGIQPTLDKYNRRLEIELKRI